MGLRKTVVCIDEYRALLETLVPVLESFGYDVWTAQSIDEAYELVANHHPEAILLDYNLCPGCPANGGVCAAPKFHAASPTTKILVWSADGSALQHHPVCAQAIFMKPLSPTDLAAHLDKVLGEQEGRSTFPVPRST